MLEFSTAATRTRVVAAGFWLSALHGAAGPFIAPEVVERLNDERQIFAAFCHQAGFFGRQKPAFAAFFDIFLEHAVEQEHRLKQFRQIIGVLAGLFEPVFRQTGAKNVGIGPGGVVVFFAAFIERVKNR
ncbi:MAG: hypothetical protein ACD_10C00312G0001 [uncultured bacterium]|nr:MAG: hypothetical protein ACD_10C00312G0001 [uncultured bacterium]